MSHFSSGAPSFWGDGLSGPLYLHTEGAQKRLGVSPWLLFHPRVIKICIKGNMSGGLPEDMPVIIIQMRVVFKTGSTPEMSSDSDSQGWGPVICLFFATLHGMWDLSSPSRDRIFVPCCGAWSSNYWTTREVPQVYLFEGDSQVILMYLICGLALQI